MERSLTAKNGIKVYEYKNPALHGFFISLFFKGGSMYESDDECGITHFLEHVLVRNVNKLYGMRLYSELDRHGLEFNASTFAEMVQFYLSGASEKFSVAADAAVKLLSPIILDKGEIDAERKRIKAEIRENDDKNSMSGFAAGEVYRNTSLKNSITGSFKSVDKITLKRLSEYQKRSFTRDNLFFYLTGNYSESDLEAFLDLLGSVEISEPSGEKHENYAPVCENFGKRGAHVAIKSSDYTMVRFNFDLDMRRTSPP
ncbi:MAG: insulinase family protein, partial [Clostridia bacterium]|nr:insulinase family protein [Clostridia bacterium]